MSTTEHGPIFIHSLHRSASTYIFATFRRVQLAGNPLYCCFQEPVHELAVYAKDDPSVLLAHHEGVGEKQAFLRHPRLDRPYFQELYEVHAQWKDIISPEIVYADYFGNCAIDKTAKYLESLIAAAPRRAVIQECRTLLRMGALKVRLGGFHIHLWRNPWDQWWSLKVSEYFDAVQQLCLNGQGCPAVLEPLKRHIGFECCHERDLRTQIAYYMDRRLLPEASFMTAFTLFILGMMEAERSADIDINVDQLSADEGYRQRTIEVLEANGIQGLEFGDCSVPHAPYDESDEAFFRPLEETALGFLRESGCDQDLLNRVAARRHQATPADPKDAFQYRNEITRRSDIVRRIERREASALSSVRHERNLRMAVENRLTHAYGELSARDAQIESLKDALAAEKEALVAREEDLACTSRTIRTLEEKLRTSTDDRAAAQARIDELNRSSHHWWTVADGLNHQLQAVYASYSWRITWPLRALGSAVLFGPRLVKSITITVLTPLLAPAIRFVLVRASFTERLLPWFERHPWIGNQLRGIAARKGIIPQVPPAAPAAAAPSQETFRTDREYSQLTPRARRIYLDLRTAVRSHQRETR